MDLSSAPSPEVKYADVVKIGPFWEMEDHIKPVWKLYWNKDAGAALEHKKIRYPLTPGNLFLIAPLTHYIPHCNAEVNHLYIHFRLSEKFSQSPQGIWNVGPSPYQWNDLAKPMQRGANTYTHNVKLLALVCHGLSLLPETLFDHETASPLQAVLVWLDKNIDKNCSNQKLGEMFGFSQDTLNRYFIKETAMSPQEYIRKLRIGKAAVLLRQTTRSVEDIAEYCGFYDRAHFHKVFRSIAGQTPAQFRKMHRNI